MWGRIRRETEVRGKVHSDFPEIMRFPITSKSRKLDWPWLSRMMFDDADLAGLGLFVVRGGHYRLSERAPVNTDKYTGPHQSIGTYPAEVSKYPQTHKQAPSSAAIIQS